MVTRPIVVGVDGSEESMQAVEWAAMEAKRHSSPLRIVSAPMVVPRIRAYHAAAETVSVALRGVSARALEAAVARSEEVAPCLRVTTDLLSGPPALAVAGSGSDASMLVVGARGTGGFAAMILGSVSRYAATHAPCPVVVVRQEAMAVHQEIAVGIRDPQDATETLAFAFEEAAARGADLVAVHAWFWFASALSLPPAPSATSQGARLQRADPDQIFAEATRALTAALDQWRDKYPKVRGRPDVIRGHPGRVLASYSARADLVVLGRHGSSPAPGSAGPGSAGPGSAGPGIGSTLHAVLDHAHGPVAIVPGRA
jgi:nucleotide-binding universal stress UspA family protein